MMNLFRVKQVLEIDKGGIATHHVPGNGKNTHLGFEKRVFDFFRLCAPFEYS
jgi:hypothetical protein